MHAVVVRVRVEDRETSVPILREQVVPRISQAPGFVTGYWVGIGDHVGTSVIVFDSEDAAEAAKEQIQTPPGVTMESVEVGEVVANA